MTWKNVILSKVDNGVLLGKKIILDFPQGYSYLLERLKFLLENAGAQVFLLSSEDKKQKILVSIRLKADVYLLIKKTKSSCFVSHYWASKKGRLFAQCVAKALFPFKKYKIEPSGEYLLSHTEIPTIFVGIKREKDLNIEALYNGILNYFKNLSS